MARAQAHRRRRIRIVSVITGVLFLTITLFGPAIGSLITQ